MSRSGEMADRSAERAPWAALAAAVVVTVTPARAQTPPSPAPPPVQAPTPADAPIAQHQADPQGPQILLEADVLTEDDVAHTVTATGNVEVRYQERTLRADSVVYDLQSGHVHAIGDVEIIGADGTSSFADEVE